MTANVKEYISGGVADYLASFCKKADNAGTSDENRKLSALFNVDIKRKKFEDIDDDRKHAKKAGTTTSSKTSKRKRDDIEDVLASTGETEEDEQTPKRSRPAYDPEKLGKTVFIGNLPISITKKKLIRLFKSQGHSEIASVRLRSAVSADPKMSKRGAVITREFHPDQKTINAYAVFTNEAAATKALEMNATELDGFHIRVDLAGNSRKHDVKTSLFVGNLPFDAEDEALRAHFSVCGHVTAVRVVRDPRTRIGKGFGFVTFDSADSISLALQMKSSKFGGRELRLQRCENQPAKKPVHKAAKPPPARKSQVRENNQSKGTKANPDGKTKAKAKPDGKKKSHKKFRPPTNKRHGTPSVQRDGKRSKKTSKKTKGKKDGLPKKKKSKQAES